MGHILNHNMGILLPYHEPYYGLFYRSHYRHYGHVVSHVTDILAPHYANIVDHYGYSTGILWTILRAYYGIYDGSYYTGRHTIAILWAILWAYCGDIMGHIMAILWPCYGHIIGVLWAILWAYYGLYDWSYYTGRHSIAILWAILCSHYWHVMGHTMVHIMSILWV